MGGNYGQVIDEMFDKYNVKSTDAYNPCNVVKIILADDDVLSNLALRSMIEQAGAYQVFPFYNGVDVSLPSHNTDRPRISMRNAGKRWAR